MPLGNYPLLLLHLRTFLGRYFLLFLFFIATYWFNDALSFGLASLLPVLTEPLAEMSTVKLALQCACNPDAPAFWQEFIARVQRPLRLWALQALRTFQQKEIAHYREAVDDIVQEVYSALVRASVAASSCGARPRALAAASSQVGARHVNSRPRRASRPFR